MGIVINRCYTSNPLILDQAEKQWKRKDAEDVSANDKMIQKLSLKAEMQSRK